MEALKRILIIIIIIVFILIGTLSLRAQYEHKVMNMPRYDNSTYHFGFTLGLNQMNFTVKPASNIHTHVYNEFQTPDLNVDSSMLLAVNSDPTLGFKVGIVGDMRLGRYFNLRFVPALSFGERYINYSIEGYRNGSTSMIEIRKSIPSAFVELPILFKYKSKRLNNMLAYITVGGQYSIDLASGAKRKDENQQVHVKLNKNDVYAIVGVGFDFYNPWFKFGTELKMMYGFFDMIKDEGNLYTDGIDRLNSKIFELSFTFE